MKQAPIDINDFKTMITIIDACTERGAIKGHELLIVGTLREKLVITIEASEKEIDKKVDNDATE